MGLGPSQVKESIDGQVHEGVDDMLGADRIRAENLIEGGHDANYRTASYDLTVGEVVGPDGQANDLRVLEPQETVIVISRERVRIPRAISGYAMPKTSLCNDGILAFSTGIIDPGYEGLVSSMLVNFGSKSYLLEQGSPFLRLTFHDIPDPDHYVEPDTPADAEYRQMRRRIAVGLPNTFLDLKKHVSTIANEAVGLQLNKTTVILGWSALGIALLTFLLAALVFLGQPFIEDLKSDRIEANVSGELTQDRIVPLNDRIDRLTNEQVSPLAERIAELEDRVSALETEQRE